MGQIGQLVVAIGGAIVGSFFGMPQLGFLLGSLMGSVLFPQKGPDGPRMSNLQVTSSAYGSFIPIGYGTARIGGNVIWSLKIKEVENTQGGKFGKGGQKTYTYFWTGAVALCKGPIVDVIRIWADTKLVFDKTAAQDSGGTGFRQIISQGKNSKGKGGGGGTQSGVPFTLYLGDETQTPNSLIEADKGVGQVPANRGLAYIVFDNAPLANYGNRVPDFSFEVVFSGAQDNPHTMLEATYLAGSAFESHESKDYIGVDWDRDRFFSISINGSSCGLMAFNIGTMDQYDERGVGTAYGPLTCDTDGNLYMNGGGLSNSDPIALIDSDSLTPQSGFGTSNSLTHNTETSFALPSQFIIFEQPSVPQSAGYLACISHLGTGGDPVGIISVPSMGYVGGGKSPSGSHVTDLNSSNPQSVACEGFDEGYGPITYIISYGSAADFIGGWTGSLNLIKLFGGSVGGDLNWVVETSLSPASIDPNWGAFTNYPSIPVLDQTDGGIIFAIEGQKSTSINWDGSLDYHNAQAWVSTKTYATFDGVKIGSTYYGSLQDNNQGNDPTTPLGSAAWAVIGTPATPKLVWSRVVKFDFPTGEFVFKTLIPTQIADYPMGVGHEQSRVSLGQYAWLSKIGGTAYVVYVDTATGDLVLDTGWVHTGSGTQPSLSGTQVFDGMSDIIIYHDANTGWSKILLNRVAPGQDSVANIITDLCGQVGLTPDDLDVTSVVDDVVDGYVITAQNSVRQNIAPLAASYFFDGVESEDKLKFVNRGGTPIATIFQPDMIAPNDSSTDSVFTETRIQEVDLPRVVSITYMDKDSDYQQGTQMSQRVALPVPTMFSQNAMSQQIPLAMGASQAINIANNTLFASWTERVTGKFGVSAKWLAYEPTDILSVELDNGATFTLRFTNVDVGADASMEITGVTTTSTAYSSDIPGGDSSMPQQTLNGPGAMRFFLWDSPYLSDQESTIGQTLGVMHFAAGLYQDGRFPGETVFRSADGTYWTSLGVIASASTWGSVINLIGDTDTPFATDYENTITLVVHDGADALETVTMLEMLNGANTALILNTNTGVAEIIQFQTVLQNADGTYTLSTLLRGRRGTELNTGDHALGEVFVLLSITATSQFTLSSDQFGLDRFYKGVPSGADFDSQPVVSLDSKGQALMPYAPVHQSAILSGSDIDLAWERRTRFSGGMVDGTGTVPLNETSEAYEVDIYDGSGSTVLRTLAVATTAVTYLAADIATDFGSTPATLTLAVYQMSSVVGRGFGKKVTVDVL